MCQNGVLTLFMLEHCRCMPPTDQRSCGAERLEIGAVVGTSCCASCAVAEVDVKLKEGDDFDLVRVQEDR